MKIAIVLAITITLATLTSCGSSGSSSTSIIPPVSASSGYSNASVTGTYSVIFRTNFAGFVGSFKADGNGNITSGTAFMNEWATVTCTPTFTGTYNLQSNASGTASLTWTFPSACPSPNSGGASYFGSPTTNFVIQAGADGASLLLVESDTSYTALTGEAIKQ